MRPSNSDYSFGLSIYRVILSFILLKNAIFYLPVAENIFGPNAIASFESYSLVMKYVGIEFLILPFNVAFFSSFWVLLLICLSFCFMLGIGRRIVGFALLVVVFSLNQRNSYILDGSDNVISVTLPFLILSDSFKYFTAKRKDSLENLYLRLFKEINYASHVALLIQISFIYFFTALHKLQGDLWLNGTATYYTMRVEEFRATNWNILLTRNHYFVVLSTYFTLFWELSFSFLVWFRKTKFIILLAGAFLHIGIWIFMRIDNFSWIMIASYSFFISNTEYGVIKKWFLINLSVVAFYDNHCPNCIRFMSIMKRLDFLNLVTWEPIREVVGSSRYTALDGTKALTEMATLKKSKSKIDYGFDSIINIFYAIPTLYITLPFLWILKFSRTGSIMYKELAVNRKIISCDNECEIS